MQHGQSLGSDRSEKAGPCAGFWGGVQLEGWRGEHVRAQGVQKVK